MTALGDYYRATAEADWHARERIRAAWRRAEAVDRLVSEAGGLGSVAMMLGISKPRVQQIVARVRELAP